MNKWHLILGSVLLFGWHAVAGGGEQLAEGQTKPLYETNFETAEVGSVPEEFLVLDGNFAVREENGNKFLELPGAPLETYMVLFGPTKEADIGVAARIYGTNRGRRSPTFGVGVNGLGGYRLQVAAAKQAVELLKGDLIQTSAPYEWAPGTWTHFYLQVRKIKDTHWKIEGKVWAGDEREPSDWTISWDETEDLWAGRPSIWGMPFAGTPIRFDDLKVVEAKSDSNQDSSR